MAKVEWTEGATKDLAKLDKPIAGRILRKITWFSSNFQRVVPEPLTGELRGAFKLRIGDWRVVYTMEDETIVVQSIGHRREIYRLK